MKTFLGVPIPFTGKTKAAALSTVNEGRGWNRIFESFSGAWQKNISVDRNQVVTFHAVYACMTLIARDIAKMEVRLVQLTDDGIWQEVRNPAYSPVLRKPNSFQTSNQFYENWVLSKLIHGNTYVLKQRDGRGVVVGLYILDPCRVTPMVADDGSVFYQLQQDNLAGVAQAVVIPAREMIHDRFNCLFHPLVGTSPIYANGLAAMQGLNIQQNSAKFFKNQSQPGGVLTAPNAISKENAERLQAAWSQNYSGDNAGNVAVLGDGLRYERMGLTAQESQMIEQMKWTAEIVASTFHVPPYKIGVGQMPTVNNVASLNVEYYQQCLQSLIEDIEKCLDEGLGIGKGVTVNGAVFGTEFDIDNLLRMDAVSQMQVIKESDGVLTPNEQRKILNKPPVAGGESVYKQQQDFSLEALAKRDAREDPFSTSAKATPAPVTPVTLSLPAPAPAVEPEPAISTFRLKTLTSQRRVRQTDEAA